MDIVQVSVETLASRTEAKLHPDIGDAGVLWLGIKRIELQPGQAAELAHFMEKLPEIVKELFESFLDINQLQPKTT